ncbi:MAG: cytochrome [Glaciihabitans sp.]|nr:cytochrome [Glaciihabitans sp.]
MTGSHSIVPDTDAAPKCPFHSPESVFEGSTPLVPSEALGALRDEAAAVPFLYSDAHQGWLVTRHSLGRAVLEDPRFSMYPRRMPLGPSGGHPLDIDDRAIHSVHDADLLSLDEPQHGKLRRTVLGRFSVRAVRGYQEAVQEIVRSQLVHLLEVGSPADLAAEFAQPISARTHCFVLGVPDDQVQKFISLFVDKSTSQQKWDFVREVIELRRDNLGDDVISDLLGSELTPTEIEGVLFVLMVSGRDSVAYMITTGTHILLSHPDQAALLRDDPALIQAAIEEFMRYGTMFVTLFPRTALEDVELENVLIRKGETVSVSPVAANRDERRFEDPDVFDVTRDSFGHLAFGHGQHGCVGQQLARLEIRTALGAILAEIPSLSLIEAEQSRPLPWASDLPTYEAGSLVVEWNAA